MEHAPPVPDLRIAAGQVEPLAGDGVLLALLYEPPELPIRVGGVGVGHGAAAVGECPPGHGGGRAGEGGEPAHDLPGRAQDQVEDQVFLLETDAAEGLEIVVVLPAQVDGPAAHGVVEEAVAAGPVAAEIEGQVFVKGVAALRPKAHGIAGVEQEPLPGLVHRAAFVPQAEDLLPLEPVHIVDGAGPQLPGEVVPEAAAVPVEEAFFRPGGDTKVFQLDGKIHPVQGEGQGSVPFRDRRGEGRKALQGELVPASKGYVRPRRAHAPGGHQGHALMDQSYPQHVGQKVEAHDDPVRPVDAMARGRLDQAEPMVELHALGSPLVSMFLRSL